MFKNILIKSILTLFILSLCAGAYATDDPQYNYDAGTITLEFDSSTNYTLSKAKVTSVFGEGSLILVPQDYAKYDDFEDADFSNWYSYAGLSQSTDNDFIDTSNADINPSGDGEIQALQTGMWKGTTTKEFRSSTNDGYRFLYPVYTVFDSRGYSTINNAVINNVVIH